VTSLGAAASRELAAESERAAREGRLADAATAVERLERELGRLQVFFADAGWLDPRAR
jgi:hypothetical protein